MKKLLFFFLFCSFQMVLGQTNIAVPSYASASNTFDASTGNIKFYLNGVSQTLTVGRGANAVCFYGNDMFVAYDDGLNGNKGIIWYANVSFATGTFASSAPAILLNGQGTFSVAVDGSGNVYCANNNGTITKFNRSPNYPQYSSIDKASATFWNTAQFADASGVMVDDATGTLWAVSYANSQAAVCKLSNFGTANTIKYLTGPANFFQKPEGIAKDASGNVWVGNNNNNEVLRINNGIVTTIVAELNANNYSAKVLTSPSQIQNFSVSPAGHQLGGLVYDNLYSSKMYVNDQVSGGNTNVYSFVANNSSPTFAATAMTQIYPGAGQCAIIPCALLPTPANPTAASANPPTINSGQSSILISSGCLAGTTFRWKEGATILNNAFDYTPSPITTTTYTAHCVRGGTCESSGIPVTVTVNPAVFTVTANPTSICQGNSSSLTATGCAGNVSWSNGNTGSSITIYPSTTTNLTATCSLGGTATTTVVVYPFPIITSSIPPTVNDCGIDAIVYIHTNETTTLSASGCTGTVRWEDYPNTYNSLSILVTSPSLLTENGMKSISLSCTHENGCTNTSYLRVLNQFATDDNFSTNINTPVSGNVITNDTETTVAWGAYMATVPTNGTITWVLGMPRPTGAFTYTPNPGFVGTETFTYFVSDDLTCSKRATVTITVGNPCPTTITIAHSTPLPTNYPANEIIKASEYINTLSPPNIVISATNSNNLTFQAGKAVNLTPGFSAGNGAVFTAKIGACTTPPAHQTFYVDGRNLKDPCGNTVILRGMNKMHIWTDQNGVSIPEMALTGANAVRIVWTITWDHDFNQNTPQVPTDDSKLSNLIALCIANKMIPIVELHDATCTWSGLQSLVDYWKRPAILAMINTYKHAMILNIGNEVGDFNVTASQFQAGYNSAVSQLRIAGITVPIMIDAPNCGNNIDILLQTGQNIITNDPLHNILLSVHTYWPMNDAPVGIAPNNAPANNGYGTQTYITTKFEAAVAANLPLLVGELANYGAWNWNYNICQQYGQVNYQWIATECNRLGIGYLAWDWGPGNIGGGNPNCNIMDMTTNATYATLWGWGADIVGKTIANPNLNNAPYTIKNAVKTPYILSGFVNCN